MRSAKHRLGPLVVCALLALAGCSGAAGGSSEQADSAPGPAEEEEPPAGSTTAPLDDSDPVVMSPSVAIGAVPPSADTTSGPVSGLGVEGVAAFLGIPFASPPVGDLRWKSPEKPAPWREPVSAVSAAPPCLQAAGLDGETMGSEDCLYLNVYAPAETDGPAPVMVWLHGGRFTAGSAATENGATIARETGTVVVVPAYRLGALGFLALPELSAEVPGHPGSGNFGLEDQVLALEWVRDNIAAFGGDPGNVTLAGVSAGGWSVCAHLASPHSRGLFQRAVMQSAPCGLPLRELVPAEASGVGFAADLGCGEEPGRLSCLRSVPAHELAAAGPAGNTLTFGEDGDWGPTVDGWILPEQPLDAFRAGEPDAMPVLMGSTSDEGDVLLALVGEVSDAELLTYLTRYTGSADVASEAAALYPPEQYGDAAHRLSSVITDWLFTCPTRSAATALAEHQPVYLYEFSYDDPDMPLGALHSSDVSFVFGTPPEGLPFDATESALSRAMLEAWAAFSASGDPGSVGGLDWPTYDPTTGAHVVFGSDVTTSSGYGEQACDFWDRLARR